MEAQGYHLVDSEPTDEERGKFPLIAAIKGGGGMAAFMTPLDAAIGKWAAAAFTDAFGQDPVRIPIMGGGVPTRPLADGLKVPILLIPLVNADNNQHAANENIRLGNDASRTKSLYALFMADFAD